MLRGPPSRITLTSSDLADFEQRFVARQSSRLGKAQTAKVRLSPGPARPTRLSFVPAEHNIGKNRAASSSSEATIHDSEDTASPDIVTAVAVHGNDSALSVTSAAEQSTSSPEPLDQAVRALDRLRQQRPTLFESSPRRQVDSFYGTAQVLEFTAKNEQRGTVISTDSSAEIQSPHPTKHVHCIPWTPRGNEVLEEINSDAYPTARHSQTEPPLLASARARRRRTKSQDVPMFRESDERQEIIIRGHGNDSISRRREINEAPIAIPELVLPTDDSLQSINLALDPGAPVFVPRTRFGTAAGSSTDSTNQQLHIARAVIPNAYADLRVRSSSEQNTDFAVRVRNDQATRTGLESTSYGPEINAQGRQRRRSRTADQNIALPHPTGVLERYPLMRPVPNLNEPQDASSLHRSSRRVASGIQPIGHVPTSVQGSSSPPWRAQSNLRVQHNDPEERSSFRSVSPAFSMNSRSTPNLLQHPSSTAQLTVRGSSLPWSRIESRTSSVGRVPSMVSAASGVSGAQQASRQSSREALDAAAEFLRMRNSPLDDLTERFSRMSIGRPRSVGRSWERPPRPRVSLLTGDPFRPEPPPNPPSSSPITTIEPSSRLALPEHVEEPESAPEDVVALALALPPSSPMASSSVALPSTPSLHFSEPRNPRSPLGDLSAVKSAESSIKRKPVPATPKVPVYDDKKPPSTQPQTPADIRGSRRRAQARSDLTVLQPPSISDHAAISSPPAVPERHPHRNTYPSTASAQSSTTPIAVASAIPSEADIPTRSRPSRFSRRVRGPPASEQAENDLEGHLQGLEEDRRTWFGRREAGNLDTTPPREGRFERYLS